MGPLVLALCSIVVHAALNVLIQRKPASIPPLINSLGIHIGALAVGAIVFLIWRNIMRFGTFSLQNEYIVAVISALITVGAMIYFAAYSKNLSLAVLFAVLGIGVIVGDVCYFAAYHKGGSLTMVATITVLLPVCTALIQLGIEGSWPTLRHVLAWTCAAAAVMLISDR